MTKTAERTASTTWEGDLPKGRGTVTVKSGAIGDFPVTWASRTERADGKTSPEELIAAAHSSCFSMALSNALAEAGNPPESLNVTSTVTFDFGQGKVTESRLTVRGRVPGLDEAGFQEAVRAAEQGCPVSNALRGNLEMPVDATLES
jgi:osmotically inducible protein OsmC